MMEQTTAVRSLEIDVNEYDLSTEEITVLRSLEKASYKAPATSLIQKVTHILRDNEAYTKYFIPHVVTIGPIHHDDSNKYPRAELVKRSLAARFFRESGTTADLLYTNVKKKVDDLKGSYDMEWEGRDDEKVALMFLVDGCAVLQFICLDSIGKLKELGFKNDLIAFTSHDLFLLENQLPYELLELLMSSCTEGRPKELKESIIGFIHNNANSSAKLSSEEKEKLTKQLEEEKEKPHHLLGMLRKRLIRGESKIEGEKGSTHKSVRRCARFCLNILQKCMFGKGKKSNIHTFRNIQELKQKGIMFGTSDTSSLEDISLRREIHSFLMATLRLPPMIVDDSTGPKFINLIAYEMCPHFQNNFEITSYVSFLDSLIDKEEDVRELRDVGVLHNGLGSDEDVAKLFNVISENLVPNSDAYLGVKQRIQEHCDSALATNFSQFYYTHFSTPWSILAFIGALLGLGLTAAQTFKEYFKNKNE